MYYAKLRTAALAACLSIPAVPAFSEQIITLNTLEIVGLDGNALKVTQSLGGGHSVRVTLNGSRNGAGSLNNNAGATWFSPLSPGTLDQQGLSQTASMNITGTGNLFAVSQSGSNNAAHGQVHGTENFSAVQQSGTENRTIFSQTGTGNRLSVLQNM